MADISSVASSALAVYNINQATTAKNAPIVNALNSIAPTAAMKAAKRGGVPQTSDSVTISDEAFELLLTKGNLRANLKVLETSGQIKKSHVDITV